MRKTFSIKKNLDTIMHIWFIGVCLAGLDITDKIASNNYEVIKQYLSLGVCLAGLDPVSVRGMPGIFPWNHFQYK